MNLNDYEKTNKKIILKTLGTFLNSLNEEQVDFMLRVNGNLLNFIDEVPEEIIENLSGLVVINFSGDTLDSLLVNKDSISFVTGFGPDNIVSEIELSFEGILSVIMETQETKVEVFVNTFFNPTKERIKLKEIDTKEDTEGIKNSMEALLKLNPQFNKK